MTAMEIAQDNAPANVVRLAEYRKRRRQAAWRRAQPANGGSQYYCLRCDADEFRLYASGNVHCARCGALMRNLELSSPVEPA
jgi:DNA-directed RNA polymerase subunit RPC12/RpoP